MDLQKTIVLRIQRERGSHLDTNYGPEGLQRTTHASSESHQWKWWTPPWWRLDWIWWFWTLRQLELIFVDSPRVFIGVFIEQRGGPGGTRGGHNAPGRAMAGCALLRAPPGVARAHYVPSGPKKISVKFRCIWTPSDIDFLWCKKHAENSNWHLALCQ